jgi:hypothetical protein
VLERWSHCQIEIDTEAVEASGLKADAPLPGVVYGNPITLRSIEELLLAAHGLGLAPAPDGEKLLLTKRPQIEEAPSYSQQLRAKELSLQLDRSPTTGTSGDARPLELEEVSLLDAIKLLQKEFRLPLALDAKAMREGRLDPAAQVSGRIEPNNLRQSLLRMLAPLDLVLEVRHEVVLVTPANERP